MLPVVLFAKPADRRVRNVKQSDGTMLKVILSGDEFFHYYCTEDGKPLVREANGDFYYAILTDEGEFVSANCLAHNEEERTTSELLLLTDKQYNNIEESLRTIAKQRRASSTKGVVSSESFCEYGIQQSIKPIGEINIPVILVQFKDEKFTYGKDIIAQNYNGSNFVGLHGKGIGSVRDYFISQSDSLFRPNFVVLDIVTLANNMAYYGGNDSRGEDKHPEQMILEACTSLNSKVDFSIFDNNGDGEVEFVYCIYAGYAESSGASANTVWPHKWTLAATNKAITLDDVTINTYAASSELAYNESNEGNKGPQLDGIGSCCHEFSHCLGLPDFYDTSGRSYPNFGMDYWDLMDYGCYNNDGYVPIGYSAYERDFMGWRKLQTITERGHYDLKALTEGGVGYKIVNDSNSNEYYILENRQPEGFDSHIFNSGMLIIHVDYSEKVWDDNEVNNNIARQRYTIIPADNKSLPYYRANSTAEYVNSLRGDVWPGTTGNNELTDTSTPAAIVYTGGYMGKSIRNITHINGIVSFSYLWDRLSAPILQQSQNVTEYGFTAKWDTVEGASFYNVELFSVENVDEGMGDIKTLLYEDFLACNRSNTDISDEINNYTINSGWYGTNIWSETGVLRIGSSSESGELITPKFTTPYDGNVKVSFVAKKYQTTDTEVKLSVFTEYTNTYTLHEEVFNIGNEWGKYEFIFPNDSDEVCIVLTTDETTNRKPRICIDDIAITQESNERETLLANYNTTANYYNFSELSSGKYRYHVKAFNKNFESDYSEKQEVVLGANTVINHTAGNDTFVEIYSLEANCVYKGLKEERPKLKKGIYVVRRQGKSEKMYIKE